MLVCDEYRGTYHVPSPHDRFYLYRAYRTLDGSHIVYWWTGGPEWSQSYLAALSLPRENALTIQALFPGCELFSLEVL